MVSVLSLSCPVCGAPFSPGAERCGYCGSILVLHTDHPRIDPRALNRAVVDEHIQEYRALLRQDPLSVKAHYGLGVAYFNLGLTEAAIDSLEKACGITPENPHIHTQLAVAWREEAKAGDQHALEEMKDHIQYALRLDPSNIEALILASEVARADHDLETALMYSERAHDIEPERVRHMHEQTLAAWINWKVQRGDATTADLDRVAHISPELEREVRARAGRTVDDPAISSPPPSPPAYAAANGMSGEAPAAAPVLRSVITAFLAGTGLFLISCVVLVSVFGNTSEGSSTSAFLGFVLLALMTLPFVLAWRAWTKTRRKDPIA